MKQLILYIFLFLSLLCKSQNFELKDKNLIRYYELTNEAENKILNNNLIRANHLYKEAFREFKQPHAKDLQNSMTVALKTNDLETAYTNYQALKCLGKNFDNDFVTNNFNNTKKYKTIPCQNAIDLNYKKSLDSLFRIDQYYRKLSGGNYQAYKKELTKNDSIAANNLLKIIQKKGFPNEYNIGLEMKSQVYFHDFYLIIWHQLATNLYSHQQVNFSNEIIKALNKGKIRPDIAGFLLDLNNNTYNYSFFKIYQFIANDGKNDCCYITEAILPEKRAAEIDIKIKEINRKRKLIGLSTTEEEVHKSIFFLNNKDYVFTSIAIEGFNFKNDNDANVMKKNLIKLDDTPH
ncbi:hypothetical protein GCM10022217_18680 [Chryseobacterium ginsenosidimutans]|uniref:hypothetical protein n=1 Tax=Chryseobacterium ginsenosidimutans TaxID=687846 RepID=UPI0031DC5BB4